MNLSMHSDECRFLQFSPIECAPAFFLEHTTDHDAIFHFLNHYSPYIIKPQSNCMSNQTPHPICSKKSMNISSSININKVEKGLFLFIATGPRFNHNNSTAKRYCQRWSVRSLSGTQAEQHHSCSNESPMAAHLPKSKQSFVLHSWWYSKDW